MRYRAAAALPFDDRDRAVAALQEQLRIMAVAARLVPDWQTLTLGGPVEWADRRGRTWFEWTATVESRAAGVEDGARLTGPAGTTRTL